MAGDLLRQRAAVEHLVAEHVRMLEARAAGAAIGRHARVHCEHVGAQRGQLIGREKAAQVRVPVALEPPAGFGHRPVVDPEAMVDLVKHAKVSVVAPLQGRRTGERS
jgi:hypothetical protein